MGLILSSLMLSTLVSTFEARVFHCEQALIKAVRNFSSKNLEHHEVTTGVALRFLVSAQVRSNPMEVHQNGHFRINVELLGEKFDLHIHPRVPHVEVQEDFRVHDHVFDLYSYVLWGELRDTDYAMIPDESGPLSIVNTESRNGIVDPQNNLSVYSKSEQRFRAEVLNRDIMRAGEGYWLRRGIFHESGAVSPYVVTVTKREFPEKRPGPFVAFPSHKQRELEKRMGFDRQAFNHQEARALAEKLILEVREEYWFGLFRWIQGRKSLSQPATSQ